MVVIATGNSWCITEISSSSLPGYTINGVVVSIQDSGGCFDVLTVEVGDDFFFLGRGRGGHDLLISLFTGDMYLRMVNPGMAYL